MGPMSLPHESRSLPAGADPVAANADSITPIAPPLSAVPTTKAVLTAGWVTGLTAAIVCLIMRVIAGLFGTDFLVARPFSDELTPVPVLVVFVVPLACGMIGALVAAIFLGVRGCQRWVFWLGTAFFVVSLASPLMQPAAVTWPTRIWLTLMHVITWVLVVPQVARVVGDSDPRVIAAYRDVVV